ncbi:TetR/AcrR family transcriptional regulator [Coraliomargarita algicola]|uniref:TetR/AcrR family transcriptional regulator n=1 Tax=Coraliomargarita algicola TaxID=3092156 RepID=A0ABZ0RKG5_9BACT|nr:TetR/AcrR family transcriptional regulator [Coraliomargarita sp. J2-16]WPJ96542.1 TetR/AcrR family transcriptional regulator [Coraliomargarita sp. J2-16]
MSEQDTRERILDAGVEIMLERSFHSVGLNQLLSAVNVPKGSFYHYFKSKEQFGVEVLRHYSKQANSKRHQILANLEISENPVERLVFMLNAGIEDIHDGGCKCPCLLQKVAIEVVNTSESMREALADGFGEMIAIFKEVVDEAVSKQYLSQELNTESEAQFILDLWAGAQQRTAIIRDVAPLRHAVAIIRERLARKI